MILTIVLNVLKMVKVIYILIQLAKTVKMIYMDIALKNVNRDFIKMSNSLFVSHATLNVNIVHDLWMKTPVQVVMTENTY